MEAGEEEVVETKSARGPWALGVALTSALAAGGYFYWSRIQRRTEPAAAGRRMLAVFIELTGDVRRNISATG